MHSNSISLKNIFSIVRYWPSIFKLFWNTKKSYFIIVVSINLIQGIFPFITLLITQELINSISKSAINGFNLTFFFFIIFIFLTLSKEVIGVLQNYYESLFLTLFTNKINVMIMEKSNTLGLADFENPKVQDSVQRAQQESGNRPYQSFKLILNILTNIVSLFFSFIYLFTWKWWVATILIFLPILSFISYLRLSREEFEINWERAPKRRKSWYLTFLMTQYSSIKEVKVYSAGEFLIQKYKDIISEFYEKDKKILIKRFKISTFFEVINISVLMSLIFLVIHSAYYGIIQIGNLVGYIQAINLTHTTSKGIIRSIINLYKDNLYIRQLFYFLELKSSDPVGDSSLLNSYESFDLVKQQIQGVEFINVSFRYSEDQRYILKNINLKIQSGDLIAIVGKNGSGKSTFGKLLTQLYTNYEGEILINGSELSTLNRDLIRKKTAIVFQDYMKYEMPVRENIGFGNVQYININESLMDVANKAGLSSLIDKFPEKLDTQLGSWFEGSTQLSGGQWQRLAIARAYLKNADIYIFDEPSSSLDPESEHEVYRKLKDMVSDKIGIIITHRYSSLGLVDKIIVMDNGQIVESGSYEKLLGIDGIFKRLHEIQLSSNTMLSRQ